MTSKKEKAQLEQLDKLLTNNLESNSEDESKIKLIEDIVFGNATFEDERNEGISEKHGKHILQAYELAKQKLENSVPSLIQCENCDVIFPGERFDMHVCTYNFDKTLIQPTYVQINVEENDFQKLHRRTTLQLRKNNNEIRKLKRKRSTSTDVANISSSGQARQSNHECFVCNRKFVHESGLHRHYDKHIGELLPQSSNSATKLYPAILCVFCGEVFSFEHRAWYHYACSHLDVEKSEPFIQFLTNDLQYEINDFKCEPQEPSAKRQKISESTVASNSSDNQQQQKIPKPSVNFPINHFLRLIYVAKIYQCECCDLAFANVNSMLNHTWKHAPLSFFSCKCCDLDGISLKDLILHRYKECKSIHDYRSNLKDIPRVWICNVCEENFLGLEQLILHRQKNFHFFPKLNVQQNELLFSCELCCSTYKNADALVSHLQDRHLKKPRITLLPETSTRTPKSPTSVKRGGGHQTSTRPRTYLCEICGKSYTQSSHLWQHLRFHQGVKPFVCPEKECGRRFTIRPDLNDHIRKCHTGERPFECTICGKRFLTGSVYYQHRLIHRGERRYGCDECGKRFYRADALKNHVRIHSGEKPFKCWVDNCHKSFRQRGDRDKHVKARHKNAPPMPSPKRKKVVSFGLGRTKNNRNLYSAKPSVKSDDSLPEPACSSSTSQQLEE